MEKMMKVAVMPGRVEEIVYEGTEKVEKLFEMAGFEVDGSYEIKLDGVVVGLETEVNEGTLLLASKKIKGNASIKVAVMPGRVEEVIFEGCKTVSELFEMAQMNIDDSYEVKLDGVVVNNSSVITGGNMIVAGKKIKGNASLKIAVMPGRVEEVVFEGCKTVKELFEIAEFEIDNGYEIKLDGVVVGLETEVNEGNMLLASKKIKGNK